VCVYVVCVCVCVCLFYVCVCVCVRERIVPPPGSGCTGLHSYARWPEPTYCAPCLRCIVHAFLFLFLQHNVSDHIHSSFSVLSPLVFVRVCSLPLVCVCVCVSRVYHSLFFVLSLVSLVLAVFGSVWVVCLASLNVHTYTRILLVCMFVFIYFTYYHNTCIAW
jgi:hypothetical protein